MVFKLLIAASGLFGLYMLTRIRNRFAWIITAMSSAGILLMFVPNSLFRIIGALFLNLPIILIVIYSFRKSLAISKRINLLIQSVPVGISQIVFKGSMENSVIVGCFMIIPIISFVYCLYRHKEYREEIGFLFILSTYSISRLALMMQHGV